MAYVTNVRVRAGHQIPSSLFCALIAISLYGAGCVSNQVYTYAMDFEYPSRAMGNEPSHSAIVLDPGNEQGGVSTGILMALQERDFSVVRPDLAAGDRLPQDQDIETGAVPISRQTLELHNRATPTLRIQPNAHYRLRYRLSYSIANKQISLLIRSDLEYSGAGGDWHPYSREYSGRFFAEELRQAIVKCLSRKPQGSS